jgi:hypothetical protein
MDTLIGVELLRRGHSLTLPTWLSAHKMCGTSKIRVRRVSFMRQQEGALDPAAGISAC